jgi:small multidrug resistance family-3 protein
MFDTLSVSRTLGLFVLAGLAEIGGSWLVWQWLRVERPWPLGVAGALVLVLYGVIVTWQESGEFGRVYAAYGGIFVIMALAWGRVVDGWKPDRWDIIGAAIVLAGVMVIMFGPRDS